jgi:hypothetical protein
MHYFSRNQLAKKTTLTALTLAILFSACNNTGETETKRGQVNDTRREESNTVPPSKVNDLVLNQFNGDVKAVYLIESSPAYYTAEGNWMIRDTNSQLMSYYFDTAGIETTRVQEHMQNGKKELDYIIDHSIANGERTAFAKRYNITTLAKYSFISDSVLLYRFYGINKSDTTLTGETQYTYNKQYRIKNELQKRPADSLTVRTDYTYNGDTSYFKDLSYRLPGYRIFNSNHPGKRCHGKQNQSSGHK